jgi:hypothetical protein
MTPLTSDSFSGRQLSKLAWAVVHRRAWFVYPQVILFVVSILYTVKFLEFDTKRSSLVGANMRYHQNYLNFKRDFQAQNDLVVVVESETPEKNRQFVERLGRKLDGETNLFRDVFYKGDLRMLGTKALLFLKEPQLAELKQMLQDYRPFIEQSTHTTNLVSLFAMINRQFGAASRARDDRTASLVRSLPALESIVTQATACLDRPGVPPSPGVLALFSASAEAERQSYITFANRQIYLVTAQARTPEQDGAAVRRLRQLVEETQIEVPGVNVGLTGEPVLELDEMQQSQKDTMLASIVSLIICALIFIYGYNETGRPLKATLCLLVGLAYTMAFTTLVVGHLNVLTITFVPILIGLAIDFGVHLVTRYEEELRHGKPEEEAIRKALVFTGQGIFTGALTTAGAFLAMGLTNFRGIQEMGIICGGGLVVCLIPMMTLLPALLLRGRQNVIDHELGDQLDRRARIEQVWLRRPVVVTVITVAFCTLAATQLKKVFFDYNLLHMQSAGLPAVELEEKLIHSVDESYSLADTNSSRRSILFAAVVAESLDEAVRLEDQIRKLPSVADVDSIAELLVENQAEKLRLIGEIKSILAPLRFAEPDDQPVNLADLRDTLWATGGYLGFGKQEAGKHDPAVAEQLASLRDATAKLQKELSSADAKRQRALAVKLGMFQHALFEDLRDTFETLRNQDNRERLHVEDLPELLRHRFVGAGGNQLLQVYPKKDAWQRANQEEFIRELRTALDPKGTNRPVITGTPVQLYEYTTLLKRSYEEAALYSLAAISLMVLIHFRSLGSVVLALLPVAIGSTWLGGIMGWLGIPLNPANIMTLPLVIGIGVTNGIHILNRFAEEQTPSILAKSTGKAVLVSGLTTIAGFGSLVLAKHRGIESLGYVMSVGIGTCMIAGLTFLPALLNLLSRRQAPQTKQPSADNA